MKKNSLFFIFTCVFLTFFYSGKAFCTSTASPKGLEECKQVASFLTSQHITFETHELLYSEENDYPFNIVINYPVNKKNNAQNSEKIETVVYLFELESFLPHKDFFYQFLTKIERSERSVKTKVLLSYGNSQKSPEKSFITGTTAFINNQIEENTCVICVQFTTQNQYITPGSNKILSPTWLIKTLSSCFYQNDFIYSVKGTFSKSLYKINVMTSDSSLGQILLAGIPGCTIEVCDTQKENVEAFSNSCSQFLTEITKVTNFTWDTHGLFLQIGNKLYILPETFSLLTLIFVSFVALFILCEFSFISRDRHIQKAQKDVLKIWYLLPIAVLVTTLGLLFGQGFTFLLLKIFRASTLLRLFIKLSLGLVFVILFYVLTYRFQIIHNASAYSYLLTVTSIANIIIFSAVDISLVYLFTIEYIIIYISRPFKTSWTLTAFFLLMLLPFFPYFLQVASFGDIKLVDQLLSGSVIVNFFLSQILLPFEIQILRIFLEIKQTFKNADETTKKFYKQNLFIISISIFIVLIVVFFVIIFMVKPKRQIRKFYDYPIPLEQKEKLISFHDEVFLGETERIISVNLPEPAENLSVKVYGKTMNNLLYSDAPYISDKNSKSDSFYIPAWSNSQNKFHYIANEEEESRVHIKAYFPINDTINYQILEYDYIIPAKTGENK